MTDQKSSAASQAAGGGVAPLQSDVVDFLSNPESYKPVPASVTRIDTHGAHVFLAGNTVIKIKRAVRYDYMDFSTTERRREACMREFALNQPHAPDIYLGVVAITRDPDGRFAFGGAGNPAEWAVHMRRFNEDDVLANVAGRKPLPQSLGKALARAVQKFHDTAEPVRPHDSAAQMHAILDGLTGALAKDLPGQRAKVDELSRAARAAITRHHDLLEGRVMHGCVKRCHGDLHLGNIVLVDGAPVLFDALEFDERMATIDVLYDLAFLLMDLDHHDSRAAANATLNHYLWLQRDTAAYAGLGLLPVFMGLRAGIRAMVRAQRAALTANAVSSAGAATDEATAYLARAVSYFQPRPIHLILVGGLSGSGKSTLAARMAPLCGPAPGAVLLRSDLERKSLFGVDETERLPASCYRPDVTARVYAALHDKARAALAARQAVIVDAVHASPAERDDIERIAAEAGAPVTRLWLDASPDVLKARVASRTNDASDATPEIVERQTGYDLGQLVWTRVDASGTPEDTFRRAWRIFNPENPSPDGTP